MGDEAWREGLEPKENADKRCLTTATSSSPDIGPALGGVVGPAANGSDRSFVSTKGVAGVMIARGTGKLNRESLRSILPGPGRWSECAGIADIDEFCRVCVPLALCAERMRSWPIFQPNPGAALTTAVPPIVLPLPLLSTRLCLMAMLPPCSVVRGNTVDAPRGDRAATDDFEDDPEAFGEWFVWVEGPEERVARKLFS
jgi:hypothetical protein